MTHRGPFQLLPFCDSVILSCKVRVRAQSSMKLNFLKQTSKYILRLYLQRCSDAENSIIWLLEEQKNIFKIEKKKKVGFEKLQMYLYFFFATS